MQKQRLIIYSSPGVPRCYHNTCFINLSPSITSLKILSETLEIKL